MSKKREELLEQIWAAQDTAYDLMSEYDSLPHSYGENVLYQAEAHLIDRIAGNGWRIPNSIDPHTYIPPKTEGETAWKNIAW